MRKVLLVLAILIVLVVGLSPIAGGVVTSRLLDSLEQRPSPLMAGVVLRQTRHERGLFSTTATSELLTSQSPEPLRLEHTVFHGPLPYARFGLAPAIAVIESQLAVTPNTESPLRARTVIDLNQNVRIELDGSPFEETNLRFDGADGEFELAPGGSRLVGQLTVKGFRAGDGSGPVLALGESYLDVNLNRGEGLPQGKFRSTIESATLPPSSVGAGLRLRDLSAEYESTPGETEGTLDTKTKLSLAELFIGPLEYRDADLEIATRNVNPETLAALRESQSRAVQSGVPPQMALQTALVSHGGQLAADGAELEITQGRIITPNGRLEFSGRLAGQPEMASVAGTDITGLLAAFALELRLDLSENHFGRLARAVAELQATRQGIRTDPEIIDRMAQELVNIAVGQGYVGMVDESGERRFQTDIRYSREGGIKINGKPFNPLALSPGGSEIP